MTADVCFVVGARPNFMKTAPVYRATSELEHNLRLLLVHTGQHYDWNMSDVFMSELGLPKPATFLGVGSGTHAEQTAAVLVGVERVLLEYQPSLVVVAGDVNSTLATALAAAKLQIPVAHIESGLRSFDNSMPEEHNRRLTDHLSAILFAHSRHALANLRHEGIDSASVHLVGNTMIDSLLAYRQIASEMRPWAAFGLEPHGYGVVTLHRPKLVDDAGLLRATVSQLVRLAAAECPIVFPAHPRTLAQLRALHLQSASREKGLILLEPLGYLAFLALEANARFVLTDSGGVQEETSALDVPCFTLRDSTERPITIEDGTNTLLGLQPERIADIPDLLKSSRESQEIPLWDGRAGERAASVLVRFLQQAAEWRSANRPALRRL